MNRLWIKYNRLVNHLKLLSMGSLWRFASPRSIIASRQRSAQTSQPSWLRDIICLWKMTSVSCFKNKIKGTYFFCCHRVHHPCTKFHNVHQTCRRDTHLVKGPSRLLCNSGQVRLGTSFLQENHTLFNTRMHSSIRIRSNAYRPFVDRIP